MGHFAKFECTRPRVMSARKGNSKEDSTTPSGNRSQPPTPVIGALDSLQSTSIPTLLNFQKSKSRRKHAHVITLEHNSTVEEAMKTLAMYNILAAPVLTGSTVEWAGSYVGMVDCLSLLDSFISRIRSTLAGEDVDTANEMNLAKALKDVEESFMDQLLITAVSQDASLVYRGNIDHTLMELIQAGFNRSTHRVAVFNAHGNISDVVSQMDVMHYIQEHKHNVPKLDYTLSELDAVHSPVVTINKDTRTISALSLLNAQGISGVAIVDNEGKLISNLSAADLRGLQREDFKLLVEPIDKFVRTLYERLRTAHPDYKLPRRPYVVTAKDTDTLASVLDKVIYENVHRIYVVDEKDKPNGVVTLTDILNALTADQNNGMEE
eukprot:CFRG5386T1